MNKKEMSCDFSNNIGTEPHKERQSLKGIYNMQLVNMDVFIVTHLQSSNSQRILQDLLLLGVYNPSFL